MSKIFSGIRDLDNLIDSLYVGDNVVWEIEAGTSPEVFALNFIRQSFSENKHVTYISFNKSPQTILQQIGEIPRQDSFTLLDCFTSGKGKNDKAFTKFYENAVHANVRKIDDPKNIDQLTSLLASLEDSFPSGGRYVFDSLTGMQDLWGDEHRTYKFFTYFVPFSMISVRLRTGCSKRTRTARNSRRISGISRRLCSNCIRERTGSG